jgi:hypothetical protein
MDSLVFMLWLNSHSTCHPLLPYSKACPCDLHVRRTQKNSLPMSTIMTCQNVACMRSCVHTESLDCFMGALETLSRSTCPRLISQTLPFGERCTLCTPCTDYPCSNCSEHLPQSSFNHLFQSMHTEQVAICSEENGVYFMACPSC